MEGHGRRVSAPLSSFRASRPAWRPLSPHIPVPGSPLPGRRRRGRSGSGGPGASETAGAARGPAGARGSSEVVRGLRGRSILGHFCHAGWAPASSSPRPGATSAPESRAPQRIGSPVPKAARLFPQREEKDAAQLLVLSRQGQRKEKAQKGLYPSGRLGGSPSLSPRGLCGSPAWISPLLAVEQQPVPLARRGQALRVPPWRSDSLPGATPWSYRGWDGVPVTCLALVPSSPGLQIERPPFDSSFTRMKLTHKTITPVRRAPQWFRLFTQLCGHHHSQP